MSTIRTAVLLLLCAALAFVCAAAAPPAKLRAPRPAPLATEAEVAALLDAVEDFREIDDPNTTLRDLIAIVQKDNGGGKLRLTINEAAFKGAAAGVAACNPDELLVGKVAAARMPLGRYLRSVLARVAVPSGAAFLVRPGYIEITTQNAIRNELRPVSENPLDDEMGGERPPLSPLVNFLRLDGDTLEAACEKVAEKTGLSVVIDPRSREAAATKIKARLANVPVDDALAVLADMAGLAVVRKANLYYLTTPKNADKFKPAMPMMAPGGGMLGGVIGGGGQLGGPPPGMRR